MAVNIFIFLFIALMWGLLYAFPMQRATTQADFRPLRYFLIAFGVIFLGNAFLAGLGARSLWAAATSPAVTSASVFGDVLAGELVILDGIVSIDNPMVLSNYVAYTACDEDTCQLGYIPENLHISLDDGDAIIRNNDFQALAWPAANNPPEPLYSADYLAPGEPVIVIGTKEASGTIWADIVYVGTYRAFVGRARQRLILPVVMTLLNLAGAVSVIVLTWRRQRLLRH
ncbi:MAG: hypothetical protein JXR84_23650 [Anaerolineae bacterium]|nr:hypothetical protein [Anaerolineae bacterium]